MPSFENMTGLEIACWAVLIYWIIGMAKGVVSFFDFINSDEFEPPFGDPLVVGFVITLGAIIVIAIYPVLMFLDITDFLQTTCRRVWLNIRLRWCIFWFLQDCKWLIKIGKMKGEADTPRQLNGAMLRCFVPWIKVSLNISPVSLEKVEKSLEVAKVENEKRLEEIAKEKAECDEKIRKLKEEINTQSKQ